MLENLLLQQAEWWLDETGMINPVYGIVTYEVEFGLYENAGGLSIGSCDDRPDFQTRANFCLLIREAIKGE